MRGFKIKFRSEEIILTPKFRTFITIFYNSVNGYELSAGGIQNSGENVSDMLWIKSDMNIGENIEIEIIEAEKQICSAPILVKKLESNPLKLSDRQKQDILSEYVKTFFHLEERLKKKGLL